MKRYTDPLPSLRSSQGTTPPDPRSRLDLKRANVHFEEGTALHPPIQMAGGPGGGSPPDETLQNRAYHENDPGERLSGFPRDSDSHRASPFRDGISAFCLPSPIAIPGSGGSVPARACGKARRSENAPEQFSWGLLEPGVHAKFYRADFFKDMTRWSRLLLTIQS
jgi:hypothetical protein